MRTIMFLRHAKSSHDDSSLKDFDRPLADRGKQDAPLLGRFLRQVNRCPDLIISSTARRAKQTAVLVADQAGFEPSSIQWEEELYYGGARDYLKLVQKGPGKADSIMLVGHNPLIEEAVSLLCSEPGSYVVRMPTAALVSLEHPALEWSQVKAGTSRFQWMMIPKLLHRLKL